MAMIGEEGMKAIRDLSEISRFCSEKSKGTYIFSTNANVYNTILNRISDGHLTTGFGVLTVLKSNLKRWYNNPNYYVKNQYNEETVIQIEDLWGFITYENNARSI